jgi:hypothetical protein
MNHSADAQAALTSVNHYFHYIAADRTKSITFSIDSLQTAQGMVLHHSLTDPIMTPFTKYFCRNGYSTRMGIVAIMIVQY